MSLASLANKLLLLCVTKVYKHKLKFCLQLSKLCHNERNYCFGIYNVMIVIVPIYKILFVAIRRMFRQAMSVIKTVGTVMFFLKQLIIILLSGVDLKFKPPFSLVDILTPDANDKYGYMKISGIQNRAESYDVMDSIKGNTAVAIVSYAG